MIDTTIDVLSELISFDTTSRNSNLALIRFVQDHLQSRGIANELVMNSEATKANLYATIGDPAVPGIVLSGHTDVVPVDGQDWSTDPFVAEIKQNRLYGRGSCDMKGFIAACLAMTNHFQEADLPMPIHFAFSYDEEIGCIGVHSLLDELATRPVKPLACIVGEPTDMQVIRAHKGMLAKRCHIQGCAGHSSMPDKGVNAIVQAAHLITRLEQLRLRIREKGPFDAIFEPPYTTVHVGRINGGTAMNIIPEHCHFDFEFRNLPNQDPQTLFDEIATYAQEELLPPMKVVSEHSDIHWQTLAFYPGLDTPESAGVNQWLTGVLQQQKPSGGVSYGTEAGLFSGVGIPTVVCGPGSINQAHRPDEFVSIEQLQHCLDFLRQLPDQLTGLQP